MGISPYPASVLLPEAAQPYPTLVEFLSTRFPRISASIWQRRLAQGKLLDKEGVPLALDVPYRPGTRVFYFREVEAEEAIPFQERILYQDDQILVCCKPHFLPVTPVGRFVEQSLLYRLRRSTGIHDLVPLHRIDRETAGLVLFSVNPETRSRYYELFKRGEVCKEYLALAPVAEVPAQRHWRVENRLVPGEPWFRMQVVPGEVNARSTIELSELVDGVGRFRLAPLTGKTHQLRVHLSDLGFPIMNDRLYPRLKDQAPDDFDRPLKLLARRLEFVDPVSGVPRKFQSDRELL
ncbi:RNA pseudouridylate synthase [Geomonas limicola]|uniref:RNA pseudouridylate synthase n=1 Tax=Geomonas limicola TaxID=2740186 RepID=A0A6V8NEH8_9BACT|nr:pseudouridine synthase [Geomonas limicola]GFO70214.1 RNA pseudouridylate synthase [Geomonas limicola]